MTKGGGELSIFAWPCLYESINLGRAARSWLITTTSQFFFLVGYVEERLWWPIQSPNKGGKKKASS